MSNIRISTNVGGTNYLKVKLEQEFDFLEILSLKISQEDVYRRYHSDYGVVVGRIIVNSGVGVPNAKVSIFVPLSDDDQANEEISTLYPYTTINMPDANGVRYNLLPTAFQSECHTPVGTFPNKREVLDNDVLFEVFDKYYKYTTTTNASGDFMLFGVPVGNHMLNVDVDLSDIGIYSQRPYDFIEQGNPAKVFNSPTKFREGTNLNNLTQLKNQRIGVSVIPFWGEALADEIGITRVDVDLNYNLKPSAIFMGSIFGDNEKNSVNKNCRPRKDLGRLCETVAAQGTVNMIRKTIDGNIEKFDIEGGRVIDEFGAWAYQIPMNLDYMVTDEYGELVPSENTTKGIPTRARVRFKISMDNSGGEGRLRSRAKYLVPHNPADTNQIDYTFDESTADHSFRDLGWNRIYTVRNHITRTQASCSINCADNRRMVGIKDVDNCVGTKNPFPFNRLDGDFNPIFAILCIIIGIIIKIVSIINGILSFINGVKIAGWHPFRRVKCIQLQCDGNGYSPNCSRRASKAGTVSRSEDDLQECYKLTLAEKLNVFEFDFYNDWINGTLFSFLLKYKKRKRHPAKFCSVDRSESNYIVDTLQTGLKDKKSSEIGKGIIKGYEGELFYAPYDVGSDYLLYATDITSLGAVFPCDWQGLPSFHDYLIPTSYQIPPFTNEPDVTNEPTRMAWDGKNGNGLLFDLTCVKMTANGTQSSNIKRLCEIGMGLDEDRTDEGGIAADNVIDAYDVENQYLRDSYIVANTAGMTLTSTGLSSSFGDDYNNFRNIFDRNVDQSRGNSFFMYFGTTPNNSALDKMNSKYFTHCEKNEKPEFVIDGIVTDVTSIGGTNGAIDITIIGGTAPYDYEWSNGQITEDLVGLTAGSYTVIVRDFNGSKGTKTFQVREPQPIRIFFELIPSTTLTSNNGILTINSILGGNNDYTMTISGPTGTYPAVNNPIMSYELSGLTVGDYTITVTDTSVPPITAISGFTMAAAPVLQADIEFLSSECWEPNDAQIIIEITGGTPPYTATTVGPVYMSGQSFTDVGVPVVFTANTLNLYELPVSGDYTVTVNDSNGQSLAITGSIEIPEPISFDFSWISGYGGSGFTGGSIATAPNGVKYYTGQTITGVGPSKNPGVQILTILPNDTVIRCYKNNSSNLVGSHTVSIFPTSTYHFAFPYETEDDGTIIPYVTGDRIWFTTNDTVCDSNVIIFE